MIQIFTASLCDAGFEVTSIDLPGHGDSPVGFNGVTAREAVQHVLDRLGDVRVVVGHSLGAGLLLDLANERKFERMVLLSPPPQPIDQVDLSHTLVVTGRFDIPAINSFAPELEGAEWWRRDSGAHTTALFNSSTIRSIVQWIGGEPAHLKTRRRVAAVIGMLLGASVFGLLLLKKRPREPFVAIQSTTEICLRFVLAAGISAVVLHFAVLLRGLRLFAADYLVSAVFVMGVSLCLIFRAPFASTPSWRFAIVRSFGNAAFVIVVIGMIAAGPVMHAGLGSGRWWRALVIAAASFPLFLHDAQVRNTVAAGILSRMIMAAGVVTGVVMFNRPDAFIILLMHGYLVFWIVLWIVTEMHRRQTKDPLASALFASLIQGWLLAAISVKL